jgi:2-C-methyl-D-erythritol 4-phosphate cytidylyltransferase
MKRIAIIVAAGTSSRMTGDVPKQFLLIRGKPVLMYSIEKFSRHSDNIIVVLPAEYEKYWAELCITYNLNIPHIVVSGGMLRAESVKNGLNLINEECIVAVHDAARPLVSEMLIDKLYKETEKSGNAIPAIKVNDTLRMIDNTGSRTVDRNIFRIVQTPQCFNSIILRKMFDNPSNMNCTDEASMAEHEGIKINLVEGELTNIKITYDSDILIAESFIL